MKNATQSRTPSWYLERLSARARQQGGACLSPDYRGVHTKLRFRCASNHIWEATPLGINAGRWCPKCFRERRKIGLDKVQAIARAAGGRCLSTAYVHGDVKLGFECSKGHEFWLQPRRLSEGRWCPQCSLNDYKVAERARLLRKLATLADERGGVCLSQAYLGDLKEHAFRCAAGHVWNTKAKNIHLGFWCPKCAREERKLGLRRMQALAKRHGGECLSSRYIGKDSKLLFRCAQGHAFLTSSACIQRGHWCRRCAMAARALPLSLMKKIARLRGGRCLSTKYVNNRTHLTWLCADGHAWRATS